MKKLSIIVFLGLSFISFNVYAQLSKIPESADPGRFDQNRIKKLPQKTKQYLPIKTITKEAKIPVELKEIKFVLRKLNVEGVTAFSDDKIKEIYQKYLDQEISFYNIWQITDEITKLYHKNGYFLSTVFIPEQEISKDGNVTINVVEGYIDEIEFDEEIKNLKIVSQLTEKLKSEKPLNIKTLESIILRLNDLPNRSFESVISPSVSNIRGAVKLSILSKKKKGFGQINVDNFNSDYIGPYQAAISYTKSFSTKTNTTFSYISSMPTENLQYFYLNHNTVIYPNLTLGLTASNTDIKLGDSLKNLDVVSNSRNFAIDLQYRIIRQRQKNFSIKMELEGRNINSDISDTPLNRDRIRELTTNLIYDGADLLDGYNYINLALTQGISGLEASEKNDNYLSRKNVDANYRKAELLMARFQNLGNNFLLVNALDVQTSSGRLYSSSKIGYGGQNFGRAYEYSEITGDRGVNFAAELRYNIGFKGMSLAPFIYYDIGHIWNANESSRILSSIGEGIRIDTNRNLSGSFTIANPIEERSRGSDYLGHKNPTYLFQVIYKI